MGELLIRLFVKDRENVSDPKVRGAYGLLCSVVGIVCNLILFAIKLIAGLAVGSVSVIADAVNNLTDASSSVISFIGFKLASKPADDEHPYGHGRYEYLSALTVAVLVIVIGVETFSSSFDKIIHPQDIGLSTFTGVVLCISVALKLWMAFFNKKTGKKINSGALVATAKDSRNDVITSLAVLAAAVISEFTGVELDGYMGIIVAVFIVFSGIGLVKEAISPVLGNPPSPELVRSVNETIVSYPGVLDTHDLIIHDYGPGRQFAGVHVEMSADMPVLEAHDIIDNIERDLYEKFGIYTSIHYDPVVTSDERVDELKHDILSALSECEDDISIHDLRIVPGDTHTNVIFDCVLPRSSKMSEKQLKEYLSARICEKHENHRLVITVDRSFTGNV